MSEEMNNKSVIEDSKDNLNVTKRAKQTLNSAKQKSSSREFTPHKLKLLFTIVNRSKAELYMTLLQSFSINMQFFVHADGTAPTEMLDYLGLADTEKALIISVVREDKADEVMHYIEEKFATVKDGKGIAFTVPMTSVIGVAIYRFLSHNSN